MKKLKSFILGTSILASLMAVSCAKPTGPVSEPEEKKVTKEFTQNDLLEVDANKPASTWAFVTYSLSDFADKEVTIDFSCDVKANNKTSDTVKFMWQVNNNGSYPEVASFEVKPGTSEIKVSGSNEEKIKIANGALLYLSTNNTTYDMTFDITNIKYTVSYGTDQKEDTPLAKEYPTNIFTVAGSKIADFSQARVFDGSQASDITFNSDGTVTYVTDAVGSGRGVVFYIKDNGSVVNISNYDSIDVELVCSPVTGHWNPKAKAPSFGFRLYTPEATGFWSGFEDIEYFGFSNGEEYGTITKNIKITDKWIEKYVDSCDNDDIMGFALKFNAYETKNDDADQIKVQLKKVQFNKKAGTPEDKKTDDGLTDEQRGSVLKIKYASHDWAKKDETAKYEKPAWVYLPAGYDPDDTETKYPLFILMHGFGQNWDTWGLTDQGTGGKIKGYMDRGMAAETVEKFILVVPTGVASASFADGTGNDFDGYGAFGGELRNDLIPYMEANFNVRTDRDGRAMAGLSMGGNQTFNIGIGECLDLISYFGTFSGATFDSAKKYKEKVDAIEKFDGLKIHQLYMINGSADAVVSMDSFNDYVDTMEAWERVEKFDSEVYEGGTHDFPVWYRGFKHLIPLLFK